MGALVTAEGKSNKKGKKGGPVQRAPFKGELSIGGKAVPVQGDMAVSFGTNKKSDDLSCVTLKLEFTVAGSEIGLKQNAKKQVKVSATIFGKPAA